MPRNHKPSKVPLAKAQQATTWRSGGKHLTSGNGYRCPESPTGAHWWQIGYPNGTLSVGVCRYCGEQRQFANTMEAAFNARGQ